MFTKLLINNDPEKFTENMEKFLGSKFTIFATKSPNFLRQFFRNLRIPKCLTIFRKFSYKNDANITTVIQNIREIQLITNQGQYFNVNNSSIFKEYIIFLLKY